MTDIEYMHGITRLADTDHERLVRHYAKLRPQERIAVHGLHTRISQKLKSRKVKAHAAAYYHATFLLAIRRYKISQNPRLSGRMTQEEADLADALQATHHKARPGRRSSAAQAIVERHYGDIRIARAREPKPESWRSIATRLSAKGQRISHTSVKNLYKKLAKEGGP